MPRRVRDAETAFHRPGIRGIAPRPFGSLPPGEESRAGSDQRLSPPRTRAAESRASSLAFPERRNRPALVEVAEPVAHFVLQAHESDSNSLIKAEPRGAVLRGTPTALSMCRPRAATAHISPWHRSAPAERLKGESSKRSTVPPVARELELAHPSQHCWRPCTMLDPVIRCPLPDVLRAPRFRQCRALANRILTRFRPLSGLSGHCRRCQQPTRVFLGASPSRPERCTQKMYQKM